MQQTNQRKPQRSRCMYCGSVDRGKGCRFGPHGVHFHSDDSTKCSYCGSTSYGKGCKINPTGDLHVHGAVYNSMYKESVQSFLDHAILLKELKKEFANFECCKLGIIDQNGNKLRNPITENEKACFTPMVKTIIKLKKYLGSKIDLLEATELLEQTTTKENIEQYKMFLEYQDKINNSINEIYQTLEEASNSGLSLESVKKLVKA